MERRPLELYIHIPFCVRKCAYCDFLSGPATDLEMRVYVEQLVQEISVQSAFYEGYGVTSIFLGGGTPSILEAEDVSRIMEAVYGHFHVEKDAEVTIEANPGTVSLEKLQIYRASGINRISIGLQSADDGELKALGRIHSYDGFLKTYERVRQAGFTNVNIDLMSALPGQTLESWRYSMTWKFSMDLVNFRFSFSRFKIFIGTFLSFIKKKNSDPSCFFYYTGKKAKSTEKFRKKGNLEIMLSIFQRSDKIKFRKRKQYGQRRKI